jgi:hypothetical protein
VVFSNSGSPGKVKESLKETRNFKEYAKDYLGLSNAALEEAVEKGKFFEI